MRDDLYTLQVPNAALFDLNITHFGEHVIQSYIVSGFSQYVFAYIGQLM